jgi:anaerobic glycerol-3-phosphate dehydrogenase
LSSTSRYTKIAVIGGGLAAHTAAATLEQTGSVKVTHIYPSSPGATAMWSGAGLVFGPQTEFVPDSAGMIDAPKTPQRPMIRERAERWEELHERREFHPYVRLGLTFDETHEHAEAALNNLPELDVARITDQRVLISELGAPTVADFAANSIADAWITPGDRVAVVECRALIGWNARRVTWAIDRTGSASAETVSVTAIDGVDGVDLHPVRLGKRLESVFEQDPAAFVSQFESALSRAGDVDALLLPPCMGTSFASTAAIRSALRDALGCRVAELPGTRHSIHGWRMDRALRAERPPTSRVRAASIRTDGPRWRVELEGDELTVDAVILATGAWMGGGLPTRPPMREPLSGLDLWLDGAALPQPDETWVPSELREQPWDDHPLFRIGVAIDDQCRPLNRRGEAEYQALFACGRMLAGSNRIWDGTTMGVDLVTGHLAALNALDATGQT